MARIATVFLNDHIAHDILLEVSRLLGDTPLRIRPGFLDDTDVEIEDEELEPFIDWDIERGHGLGCYCGDRVECQSRRIDLRGPTDLDPGPLPMEEAPEDITAKHLILAPPLPRHAIR